MKLNIFKAALAMMVAASAVTLTSCSDDEYTSRGDLFQPRFVLSNSVKVVNNNDAQCIWYEVNDAVSYTVEIYTDQYYSPEHLYMAFDTPEPYFIIEDLPYGTNLFVRVRSNAADPIHSSRWAKFNFFTEDRPEYAQLLNSISRDVIEDNAVTFSWDVDLSNPVDSFSLVPAMGGLTASGDPIPTISGMIPAESMSTGVMRVSGLTPSTLYNLNVYDTSKPRRYDKPYNTVTFRTTGPAPAIIEVGLTDDLNQMLRDGNSDPDVPEGTVYSLPSGASYIIAPFALQKGFKIVGPEDGDMPTIMQNGTWSTASGAYISVFGFENVQIQNQTINQYFFNTGSSFTIEEVALINVKFYDIKRGFWRHQNANKKVINNFLIENCWFDKCGYNGTAGGSYGFFNLASAGKSSVGNYDQLDELTIRNTTFSRCWDHNDNVGWPNLIDHSHSYLPIKFTLENCTFYDYCKNNNMIMLTSTENSTVVIKNNIVASPCGTFISLGSGSKNTFVDNFWTTDYKQGLGSIKGVALGISAADLFVDPENGNYTIKDKTCEAYQVGAGDPRWLK
ncbi:MAG: DUF5123 domain-containing protein [Muribaculaceae bacterium]|nr:DUF5123 domain-containing protein [Muribaculaceae bacterium]